MFVVVLQVFASKSQRLRRGIKRLPVPVPAVSTVSQARSASQVQILHTQCQERGDQGHG